MAWANMLSNQIKSYHSSNEPVHFIKCVKMTPNCLFVYSLLII